MRATLTDLRCLGGTTIDLDFISSLCIFQKLTHVFVDSSCSKEGGCTFLLTDDDVTRLANALPDIKNLRLGSPCSSNPCHTTPFSLTLSTRCLGQKTLEVHFNSTNIKRVLFKEPQYENMRLLQRRPLHYLTVADTPIPTRDVDTVAIYLSRIFHDSQEIRGRQKRWAEASRYYFDCEYVFVAASYPLHGV